MIANNTKELEQQLLKEIQKAMGIVSKKALADMYDETGDFYTQGNPKIYQRTGALGDTPRTTALTSTSKSVAFNAFLDTSHVYTTGDEPTMYQVLNLANSGIAWTTKNGSKARDVLGKKGFWERAELKIENDLKDTMNLFFK